MKTVKYTLKPIGPFASPLLGDTLFGQLCWTIVRAEGEAALNQLLAGYAQKPFVVFSDAFPADHLPKPTLPTMYFGPSAQNPKERKVLKRKQWMPLDALSRPLDEWLAFAKTDQDLLAEVNSAQTQISHWQRHMHNSIDRRTGTTGEVGFAPYAVEELWFAQKICLDIYAIVDEQQISADKIYEYLVRIGELGYGKDANIGAGRFNIEKKQAEPLPQHNNSNAVLTLANVAPQGLPLRPAGCFYQPFTRYGRHGDWAVLVNPFKSPILMAKTGAVLTPAEPMSAPFIGQALGGNGEISKIIPQTVHQGYAPVVHIHLPIKE